MFERFTERAREVVVLAQNEAERLRHGHIGTEHLLVGLVHEGEGVAAQALMVTGVTLDGAREQVEATAGYGEADTSQRPFAWDSRRTFEASLREAMSLGHNYIGTEHLLLGLTNETEGVAVRVLRNLGVDPDALRREVVRRLAGGETEPGPPDESGTEREEGSRTLFRGQVSGIRAEVLYPDEGEPGEARAGGRRSGLRVPRHAGGPGRLRDLEPRRALGPCGEVFGDPHSRPCQRRWLGLRATCCWRRFPSVREVTVTVTREGPPPGVSVSATLRR